MIDTTAETLCCPARGAPAQYSLQVARIDVAEGVAERDAQHRRDPQRPTAAPVERRRTDQHRHSQEPTATPITRRGVSLSSAKAKWAMTATMIGPEAWIMLANPAAIWPPHRPSERWEASRSGCPARATAPAPGPSERASGPAASASRQWPPPRSRRAGRDQPGETATASFMNQEAGGPEHRAGQHPRGHPAPATAAPRGGCIAAAGADEVDQRRNQRLVRRRHRIESRSRFGANPGQRLVLRCATTVPSQRRQTHNGIMRWKSS